MGPIAGRLSLALAPEACVGRTVRVSPRALLAVALVFLINPGLSAQQDRGSAAAAVGGAVLGAYSGAAFGLLGAYGPCNRTLTGARCPRLFTVIGASFGLVAGIHMGLDGPDELSARWRSAGYGAAVAGLVGAGLSLGVRQYGWQDVGMFMAVGAGIGASPVGALLGFVAGGAAGTVGWLVIPEMKLGDAAALSLLGLGVGGLMGWALGAEAHGDRQRLVIPLQVRFR